MLSKDWQPARNILVGLFNGEVYKLLLLGWDGLRSLNWVASFFRWMQFMQRASNYLKSHWKSAVTLERLKNTLTSTDRKQQWDYRLMFHVCNTLCRKRKLEGRWAGTFIARLPHLGNTSTNRVEGARADLKKNLKTSSSFYLAFKTLDQFYNIKVYILCFFTCI